MGKLAVFKGLNDNLQCFRDNSSTCFSDVQTLTDYYICREIMLAFYVPCHSHYTSKNNKSTCSYTKMNRNDLELYYVNSSAMLPDLKKCYFYKYS